MPSSAGHYPPGQQQQQQQQSVIQKWALVRPDTLQDLLAGQRGASSVHHGGGTNIEDKDCHHLPIIAAGLGGPLCVLARQQHGHLMEVPVGHQQRNFIAPAGKRRQLGDGWEAPPMGRRQLLQDLRQELDLILHLSGHRGSHAHALWHQSWASCRGHSGWLPRVGALPGPLPTMPATSPEPDQGGGLRWVPKMSHEGPEVDSH